MRRSRPTDRGGVIQAANDIRYDPQATRGHYESFFLRANHPHEPRAFWIRYTIFSPVGRPHDALGELWAIVFDGTTNEHVAAKLECPLGACRFASGPLDVMVAGATLGPRHAAGRAGDGTSAIAWDLTFDTASSPLLLLPPRLYDARLPRAKSLVSCPLAMFDGCITIGDREVAVRGWPGSQNHNWGSRHTDHYAWGQVVGFDERPDAFLEVATAWLRFGPCWTPPMTPLVLRLGAREIRLNALRQTLRTRAALSLFRWTFDAVGPDARVVGTIEAPRSSFVGLRYRNPPGGEKHCLNSKIATCALQVEEPGRATTTLTSRHRAAFEVLTDRTDHRVDVWV